jgi:NADPH:quinone reductase-like Zn-dependent oxidoreductase
VFAGGYAREELDAIHSSLATLVGEGRLRNAVTAQIPFGELNGALDRMVRGGVVGKWVLVP